MNRLRPYRLATVCLFVFLMLCQIGCAYYQRYPMSKARLPKIETENLTFYLIDPSRPLSGVWYVDSYTFGEKSMKAYLSRLSEREALEVVTVRNNRDARNSKNEVLIYVKPQVARGLADTVTTNLSYEQLEKVEVYEMNYGKTLAFNFLGYVAAGFTLALLAFGEKDFCPFVYALNPEGAVFEGELYAGAIYPQLERQDWLPMPHLKPDGGDYRVRLANKAKEVQHTNLLELIAIDHPASIEVLFDKKGQLQTICQPQTPIQALDMEGRDVKKDVEKTDTLFWGGGPVNHRPRADQGLTLRFAKPAHTTKAKLVIHAKNTYWLDYAHGLYLDAFGAQAEPVRQAFLKKSETDVRQWLDEQNLPLSVLLETSPGQWTKSDYFHLAGPMALKKDVLELDLSHITGNDVNIRLESGFQFWEIDYVALDFSENIPVQMQTIQPETAITNTGQDARPALLSIDNQYYTQPNIGDEAIVRYPVPPQSSGTVRSLLLHTKGHYDILRQPALGKPSPLQLRNLQKPDAFAKYSRLHWQELMTPATSK